jgi:hypothetical protein
MFVSGDEDVMALVMIGIVDDEDDAEGEVEDYGRSQMVNPEDPEIGDTAVRGEISSTGGDLLPQEQCRRSHRCNGDPRSRCFVDLYGFRSELNPVDETIVTVVFKANSAAHRRTIWSRPDGVVQTCFFALL